ncbi:MAG TPA: response regulator transcription factor [Desulfobacteraceae bacterium]|nr:response regulator transcription factor [Desulfobacteraceae bacterium]
MMLMGGRLEVESSPETGSSFSLVLPSEHTEPNQDKSAEKEAGFTKSLPSAPVAGARIRVMLVDDHEVMRNGLSTLLGNYGDIDIVGQASDGEEAVRSVGEVRPDVILMDINMPGMNGLEATRRIHSEFPHIRIIVLSMHEGHDISETALNAGASSFHTKSGSTDRLLAAIRGETG